MSQRDVLAQATNLMNTLRGPAKIYYATSGADVPSNIYQALNATTGAPVAPWVSFGFTRGGVNVVKNETVTDRDDLDQIIGRYDADITDISYSIVTQMAEVLDRTQAGMVMDLGVPTVVFASAGYPTQFMIPLDSGSLDPAEWRWLVWYPSGRAAGKGIGFYFRRGQIAGGEKPWRFDRNDPVSPPLEVSLFPEISTAITADDAYGRIYQID